MNRERGNTNEEGLAVQGNDFGTRRLHHVVAPVLHETTPLV